MVSFPGQKMVDSAKYLAIFLAISTTFDSITLHNRQLCLIFVLLEFHIEKSDDKQADVLRYRSGDKNYYLKGQKIRRSKSSC